jgi:transcriptional regulator with XRE-family HTH domain
VTFGQIVKQLRQERGLSQADVATYLDVSQTTIAAWEARDKAPSEDKLRPLANLFNVPVLYFYERQIEGAHRAGVEKAKRYIQSLRSEPDARLGAPAPRTAELKETA